jgi:hypothetical protein
MIRQSEKTVTKPFIRNTFGMRQVLSIGKPFYNQNAVEKKTSQESPFCESEEVGSLNKALKRVRSERKDIFRVKLGKKRGSETPQSDLKSHSGTVKPIIRYLSSY